MLLQNMWLEQNSTSTRCVTETLKVAILAKADVKSRTRYEQKALHMLTCILNSVL